MRPYLAHDANECTAEVIVSSSRLIERLLSVRDADSGTQPATSVDKEPDLCQKTDYSDIYTTCAIKGHERYIWVWRADQLHQVYRSVTRMAADQDLSLTWADAAAVMMAITTCRTGENSPG